NKSLAPQGMPCSGPRYLPRLRSLSADCACFIAKSSVSVTTQRSFGAYFFKRARYIFVNSTDETFFVRISSDSCGTVANARSLTDLYWAGSFLLNVNVNFAGARLICEPRSAG